MNLAQMSAVVSPSELVHKCSLWDSDHFVSGFNQALKVIVWLAIAGGIIVAILLFSHEKKEFRKLAIAELIFTVVAGICLLITPALDARLGHFQQVRISNDETNLIILSSQLKTATNELTKIAEVTKTKPLKERLVVCLNSIDPNFLIALRAGRTSWHEMSLRRYQKDELEKLAREPGASEYIGFIDTGHGVDWGGVGSFDKVNLELAPELLK